MDDHAHTRSHLVLGLAIGLLIGTCIGYFVGTWQMMQGFTHLHQSSGNTDNEQTSSTTPTAANPENPLRTIPLNPFN